MTTVRLGMICLTVVIVVALLCDAYLKGKGVK